MSPIDRVSPSGFFTGLAMPFRGLGFVGRNPGLARIWIFPVLLVFGLLLALCAGSGELGQVLADRYTPIDPGEGASFFEQLRHAVMRGFVVVLGWVLSFVLATLLAPVVAAPFNDMLGEEVERIELGIPTLPFSWSKLGRDLVRTVRLELTKLLLYFAIVVPLTVAGFFFGPLAVVSSALSFLFTAAYFALDYVDGPLTRRNVGVRRRFALFRSHPAPMLGFGVGVFAMLFVPLLNLFFMPAAVAGGTMLCARLGLIERVDDSVTRAER